MFTLLRPLKLPKLMRLGRLFKSLEKLEGAANVANIVIMLVIMVVANHWISCLWFLITKGTGGWVESMNLNGTHWTRTLTPTLTLTLGVMPGDSLTLKITLSRHHHDEAEDVPR